EEDEGDDDRQDDPDHCRYLRGRGFGETLLMRWAAGARTRSPGAATTTSAATTTTAPTTAGGRGLGGVVGADRPGDGLLEAAEGVAAAEVAGVRVVGPAAVPEGHQIGRASCRERVESSVGAGA